MELPPISLPNVSLKTPVTRKSDPLRHAAEAFEAIFVSEMLRHSGVGKMPEAFNGGAGEAQFADLLIHEYGRSIAKTGRLGIADQIYAQLKARA